MGTATIDFSSKVDPLQRRDDVCENTPRQLFRATLFQSLKSCVCERDARAGRGLAQRGPLK